MEINEIEFLYSEEIERAEKAFLESGNVKDFSSAEKKYLDSVKAAREKYEYLISRAISDEKKKAIKSHGKSVLFNNAKNPEFKPGFGKVELCFRDKLKFKLRILSFKFRILFRDSGFCRSKPLIYWKFRLKISFIRLIETIRRGFEHTENFVLDKINIFKEGIKVIFAKLTLVFARKKTAASADSKSPVKS